MQEQKKTRVVIIGAGFAGIYVAKALVKTDAEVIIIDKQNHHLFQPLLYQVAAGILSAGSIATPIRAIIGKNPNTYVRMEEVIEIDRKNKVVRTDDNEYDYDYLVLGTGSTYDYFGNDQWKDYTYTLKTLADAVKLRNHIYYNIEKAFITHDPEERKKLLTFTVIGGGPTGVEMAGVIAEVAHKLTKEEIKASFDEINIYLIEAMDRILGAMDADLAAYAHRALETLGVKVKINSPVKEVAKNFVRTADFEIQSGTIIWAAGVKAVGASALLTDIEKQRGSRIKVNQFLQLEEDPHVFLIGDSSLYLQEGKPLPSLGSVAKQQGIYLGNLLRKKIKNIETKKAFVYHDLGVMAVIGKRFAIAKIGNMKFTGTIAWFLWLVIHVLLLISFRNRLWVVASWFWTYLLNSLEARNINKALET